MEGYIKLPIVYMRGGTSKGAYINVKDLPVDKSLRDAYILSLYGSPDKRQIDGIGGADPLTSKVALVGISTEEGIDVDYTFGYVGIDKAVVDYEGNCGNMSAAVGIFAIMQGMVNPVEPITKVIINNTNTNKIIEAHIPVKNGEPLCVGDVSIDGVPGSSAEIILYFLNPAGSKTGKLLPTGNVRDKIALSTGQELEISCVDAATPGIFVKAEDLGYLGTELPADIEDDSNHLLDILEEIRVAGALLMGLADNKERVSEAVPKVCLVGKANTYTALNDIVIEKDKIDIVARTKALSVIHKAYAVTGGICTATASLIPGTVVYDVVSSRAKENHTVILGHPGGTFSFSIDLIDNNGKLELCKAGVVRTARPIMEGVAYVAQKA